MGVIWEALGVYYIRLTSSMIIGNGEYNKGAKLTQNGGFTSYPLILMGPWDVRNTGDSNTGSFKPWFQEGEKRCQFRIQFFTSRTGIALVICSISIMPH